MHGLYDEDFVGYKIASPAELDTALREAVVAVDASVLLDLYRFRPAMAAWACTTALRRTPPHCGHGSPTGTSSRFCWQSGQIIAIGPVKHAVRIDAWSDEFKPGTARAGRGT